MDSPGGYQLVGRTLPIWSSFGVKNALFTATPEELDEARAGFRSGRYNIKVEPSTFNLAEYNALLAEIDDEVQAYKVQQTKASTLMLEEEEKSLAKLAKLNAEKEAKGGVAENLDLKGKGTKLCADISANVWKVCVAEGD